jgi:dynamin 1-like protein
VVERVLGELQRLLPICMPGAVARFPALHERILRCGRRLLDARAAPTNDMVSNLIDIELAYLNTAHPDFLHLFEAIERLALPSMGMAPS